MSEGNLELQFESVINFIKLIINVLCMVQVLDQCFGKFKYKYQLAQRSKDEQVSQQTFNGIIQNKLNIYKNKTYIKKPELNLQHIFLAYLVITIKRTLKIIKILTDQKSLALFLVVAMLFPNLALQTSCLITSSNVNANQFSDFSIDIFEPTVTIPINSVIIITFPKQFSAIQLYDGAPYTGNDPSSNFCPSDCSTVTIVYSAYNFVLKSMFTAQAQLLVSYTFFNIKNPSYEIKTGDFLIQIKSSNFVITHYTQTTAGYNILAQNFQTLSSSLDYPYLWSISQVNFDVGLSSDVNFIRLIFPSKWLNQSRVNQTIINSVLVTSSTHSVKFTKQLQIIEINFPQIFSAQTLKINFKSVYTPSSVMNMGPIIFYGYNSKNQVVRQSTIYIQNSSLTHDSLRQLQSSVSYDEALNKVNIKNKFKFPRDGVINDKVSITYPSQISISTIPSDYVILVEGVVVAAPPTFPGSNTIQIYPFSRTIFQPDIQVRMTITWSKSVSTQNFTIGSFRKMGATFSKMQQAVCCALWIKQKPTLIATLLMLNNERLKTNVKYKFDITHSFSTLSSSDSLLIQFPPIFIMDVSKQASICSSVLLGLPSNPSNLNAGHTCSLTTNILTLSNIFLFSQSPTLMTIQVSITNPSATPKQNFIIWSQDSTGAKIQSNNLIQLTISPARLNSVSVLPESSTTNKKTNYQLTIQAIGIPSKNSIVKIKLPTQIRVQAYSINCQVNAIQQLCTLDKVNHAFQILISSSLVSRIFVVRIFNIINPETLLVTPDFNVQIMDTAGNLVQSSSALSSGLSTQMTQVDSFLYQRMWFDKRSLDEKGNLKFILATNRILDTASNYKITLIISPSISLHLQQTVSILKLNGNIVFFSGTNSTSQYLISFSFVPPSTSNLIQFQFSQVLIFQDIIAANIVLSKQVSSTFHQSVRNNPSLKLSNNLHSVLIPDYQVHQDSYLMNESPGLITLKINTISANVSFSYVIVSIPRNYQSISGTYIYNSTSPSLTITFLITDILNPIQVISEAFTFVMYDSDNQIVGLSQPSNQYFSTKCTFPCKSCKSQIQPHLCLNCYQLSGNANVYFRQTQAPYGQCIDHCQSGQYLDVILKKCVPCSSNCSTCIISTGIGSGDPQKCVTCNSGNYLLNQRCFSTCPNGQYSNNLICSPCIDNCAKCSSLDNCSQCVTLFFYYQELCLQSCPLKTYASPIPSSSLSQCINCSSNCLKCSDVNTCIFCVHGFYLSNFICLSSCPIVSMKQLYPDLNNICKQCECQSCVNWSYNCTSCSLGLLFDSSRSKCLTKCKDGEFNNSGTCGPCASECLFCLSLNNCQKCKQPFILYKLNSSRSQCLSVCPISTLLTIQTTLSSVHVLQCLACGFSCSKCVISPNFCTQCISNAVFFNNLCLDQCPVGYYNISNYCNKCSSECQSCDIGDPKSCTQCNQGYYLSNNFCYSNCPSGTFSETSLKKCLNCQPLCETCLNVTHCTSCKSGYFLFTNNLCYNSCPTTPVYYYKYNSQCMLCQPQCTSCISSPIQCTSCSSVYYYQNQDTMECSTTCAENYFSKQNKCTKCQAPCLTCDQSYDSCLSCNNNSLQKYLYQGKCFQLCPIGYYGGTFTNSTVTIENTCVSCIFPCLTCSQSQCFTCQLFSYMYKQTCVLDCQTTSDMPYSKDTYCTNCVSIPFCTFCETSQVTQIVCLQCTYPYVLFQGQCLNYCPHNYELFSQTSRSCTQSPQYTRQKKRTYEQNSPYIPFVFLAIFLVLSLSIYLITKCIYEYTYHLGYQIFLINLLDHILIYNWLLDYNSKYSGEYYDQAQKDTPLIIIAIALILNLVLLGWIAFAYVIKQVYLKDISYNKWKNKQLYNFITLLLLVLILGPRSHKLYYSKLFGLERFSFRVISVEKFHLQDRINLLGCFGDIFFVVAFFIIAYNVNIQFSVLYFNAFQILGIKILTWILLAFDSKKPDRGFFYGDEKIALQQIQKEDQQNQSKIRRLDTDHLIKLIRQKSAGFLSYNNLPFGQLQRLQSQSVYDPNDFQQVPKVPFKKIRRNIQRGKFRKGRRITIEEKLQRFADSIKPKPKVAKTQEYLHGMIYWKPPKKIKVSRQQKVEPLSQESMIKILQNKEIQYKSELQEIQNIIFEQEETNHHNFRTGKFFYKNSNHLNFDSYNDLGESNPSIQEFEDLSNQIFKPEKSQIEYNDLMNLNYAKKKHLPLQQKKPHFDDNQMRILYHQPMKKRSRRLQH